MTGAVVSTESTVWLMSIDRPQRRNAMDSCTARNLSYMLQEANASARCGAVVLAGAGGWFCAGSDLKELAGLDPAAMVATESAKAELARVIQEVDVPVLAAVEGLALGGGVAIAAACDLVVSARGARWHMPEVLNGWLPPWGIEPVISRCGNARAKQILWGAAPMDADQAQSAGLVDLVCEPGQALQVAQERAAHLDRLPRAAQRSVKRYLRDPARRELQAADRLAAETFAAHCATPRAQATLNRFGGTA